jgi:hypothetical protein
MACWPCGVCCRRSSSAANAASMTASGMRGLGTRAMFLSRLVVRSQVALQLTGSPLNNSSNQRGTSISAPKDV